MYHVVQTHPQLVIPARFGLRDDAPFDPQAFIDADIQYLRAMSDGMDGMCHADDVRIAESLRDLELPADRSLAMATWNRTLNDAVVRWHRDRGHDIPDLNELDEQGINLTFFHGFPHYFVLPMYSSASAYRFRPLGPEETLMEIWSLARFPEGEEHERPTPPEVWECDDPRWPAIPAQDFSNLPRQQKGLHAKGFEYMRLSSGLEGHISNFERTIDGFLAGLPYERLLPALAGGQRVPLRAADARPRLLMGADTEPLARRRRGGPRRHRGVHARARRRPHRRRRRHLLRRRRRRDPGHGHARRPRRPPRGLRPRGRRGDRSVTSCSTPWSPTGTTTRRRRSATWSSSCRATRAGRSSSSAATTTRSTTTVEPGGSTVGRPSS